MNEADSDSEDAFAKLKARADALEQQLHDTQAQAATRLRQVELKSAALHAGILDLDGLRLLDPATYSEEDSTSFNASDIVSRLRR